MHWAITSGLIEVSMCVGFLWFFMDSLDKGFTFSQLVFVFCKVNVLLFSSLLNMIIASVGLWSVGRWVSGRMADWSVVGGFNKTQITLRFLKSGESQQ